MSGELRERLTGRWGDILPHLGIPVKFLNGRNQPCPLCGGKDRARFTNLEGHGTFFCNRCGAGDGVTLVMKKNGVDFRGAKALIEPLIGAFRIAKQKPPKSERQRRDELNAMWASGRAIIPDTTAGKWLTMRCGITEYPRALRSVDSLRCFTDGVARFFSAMIALVSGPDGKPVSIYRTWLTPDGQKAPIDPPRKMMPGTIPKGSAIRLWDAAEHMGVGEGIETCISASLMRGIPVWPTLGTSGLLGWEPPPIVKHVTIFGDCDRNYAGQAASFALAHRLLALPNRALEVDVEIPGIPQPNGDDWNDVARKSMGDFV